MTHEPVEAYEKCSRERPFTRDTPRFHLTFLAQGSSFSQASLNFDPSLGSSTSKRHQPGPQTKSQGARESLISPLPLMGLRNLTLSKIQGSGGYHWRGRIWRPGRHIDGRATRARSSFLGRACSPEFAHVGPSPECRASCSNNRADENMGNR